MRFTPSFYRAAALCSFATALTTLALIQPLGRTLIGVWLWTHRDEDVVRAPA